MKDKIPEKIDELANLCELWKINRENGHNTDNIRQAIIMIADKIILMESVQRFNDLDLMDKLRK